MAYAVLLRINSSHHLRVQKGGGSRKMTWWQGGGGAWIPPKSDDVIYEQPLMGLHNFGANAIMLQKKTNYFDVNDTYCYLRACVLKRKTVGGRSRQTPVLCVRQACIVLLLRTLAQKDKFFFYQREKGSRHVECKDDIISSWGQRPSFINSNTRAD